MERARRERFANVAPSSGEVALVTVLTGGFCVLITPLVVQGLVGLVLVGEFLWPTGRVFDALGGLAVHQEFGHGIRYRGGARAALPPDAVMWVLVLMAEVVVIVAVVLASRWLRGASGSGSHHGLATRSEASTALGLPRLRATAAVIRPDLYGPHRAPPARTSSRPHAHLTD